MQDTVSMSPHFLVNGSACWVARQVEQDRRGDQLGLETSKQLVSRFLKATVVGHCEDFRREVLMVHKILVLLPGLLIVVEQIRL